jgi:hypothetical protein
MRKGRQLRADRQCAKGTPGGYPSCGVLPQARDQRRNVLRLAHEVRRHGGIGRTLAS